MNPLLFTDPAFLFFFAPIVLTAYWIVPAGWRDGLLLAASVLLYAWGEARYVGVLLASIGLNWVAGAILARTRLWSVLAAGVTLNLMLLAWFKYAPAGRLPVGLSFYTFIGISYLVDLHRRDLPGAAGLGRVGLLLAMFPHLIAGPIVRMTELGGQFGLRYWNTEEIAWGVRRFVIGLGKKVLIANSLAVVPDAVFGLAAGQIPTGFAWLALLCYSLQIYFDFSGYSDMAIGLARMLGFRFPENFRYPYVSRSITEFWRRWHITLSTWLRDYLFFALGGTRGLVRNLLIVFALCGLWHGASWNFVAWGVWHGLLLSAEQLGFAGLLRRSPVAVQSGYTLAAVASGWVLFRASTMQQAAGFWAALAGFGGNPPADFAGALFVSPVLLLALAAGVVAALPWKLRLSGLLEFAALALVFVGSLAAVAGSTYDPFIYFRF